MPSLTTIFREMPDPRPGNAQRHDPHWVCVGTFGGDAAKDRADSGPENHAILRRRMRNLLQTARPNLSVSRKRKRAGWTGWADAFTRFIGGQTKWPCLP